MIQLRWLKRPTGKTITNSWGYLEDELECVLQFRQEYNAAMYAGNPSDEFKNQTRQMVWSGWQDVPTVTQMEQV